MVKLVTSVYHSNYLNVSRMKVVVLTGSTLCRTYMLLAIAPICNRQTCKVCPATLTDEFGSATVASSTILYNNIVLHSP